MVLHTELGPNLTAAVLLTGTLAFLTMGMRVYTRITKRNWGTDDWIMLFGCIPLLTLTIVTALGSYHGIGAKDSTLARPNNESYVELAYFVRDILSFTAAWKSDLRGKGYCDTQLHLQNVYFFCTSVNIFTDWATALMPIPLLWKVQMSKNTKVSVAGILGLGIFTSVTGLVRLKYTVSLTSKDEFLYGLAKILIWGYAEPALGMLVGNISTLRPLFHRILHLGANGSDQANTRGGTTGIVSSKRQSNACRPFDFDFELGIAAENIFESQLSTQIHGGRSASGSETESQKESREKGRIVVSQQVEVSHQ
ncbi:hypothetical protein PtrM4_147040 [Pyrenophora tritici-repentis]|uniref:Rhodopsin domain-containing protein n=1 Tax=Pyrenophora tritici-repentis TaxID=45151 RepID=A0A834RMZ3_9PLEO|nr:hypothetical protein A1F99_119670 [Pyrenophora tritici-repentis]KAF7566384.1 hypothetical protein PtrM4_147040 [Pyrenophora tritici-repentis]